jgi:hypothetical protein
MAPLYLPYLVRVSFENVGGGSGELVAMLMLMLGLMQASGRCGFGGWFVSSEAHNGVRVAWAYLAHVMDAYGQSSSLRDPDGLCQGKPAGNA